MNSQPASMSEHQTIEWKEVWRDEYLKAYISYEGVQRVERLLGKHPSNPYNPLIANTFFRCGYIESWGRGIEKINRECKQWGIPAPVYDYGMSGLMLTFHANLPPLATVLEKTPVKTPERIMELLTTNPELTLDDVSKTLGKSLRAIERAVAKLKAEERLQYVGSRKNGRWEILT